MAEEEEQNVEATEPEVEETAEAEAAPAEAEAEAPAEAEAEASEDAGEAAEAAAEPEPEPDPLDDLPRKERLRLLKSRKPNPPKPPRSGAERQAEREEERKRKARQRAKRRAEARAEAKKNAGAAGTPPAERESNQPKVRQGVVVSNKADKTITVRIDTARRHRRYEKIVRRSRTLHAHDERNEAAEGDTVRVVEARPLSKTKRWRLVEIVEKAR